MPIVSVGLSSGLTNIPHTIYSVVILRKEKCPSKNGAGHVMAVPMHRQKLSLNQTSAASQISRQHLSHKYIDIGSFHALMVDSVTMLIHAIENVLGHWK